MKKILMLAIGAVGLMAGSCSTDDIVLDEQPSTVTPPEEEVTPDTPQPQWLSFTNEEKNAAKSMQSFNYGFFREVNASLNTNGNVLACPVSAQLLLSMLANATEGSARDEIVTALGCKDMDAINSLANKYITQLPVEYDGVEMALANSLWYDRTYELREDFASVLAQYYGAESNGRDFSDKHGLVTEINRWCADKTNDRISRIISDIPEQMEMIMANALYFKAPWGNPFDEEKTTKKSFMTPTGPRDVDMMAQRKQMRYAEAEDFRAVEIPFAQHSFYIWFVLPSENIAIDDFVSSFDLSKLDTQITTPIVELSMPKFQFDGDNIDMETPLRKLGVKTVFNGTGHNMFTKPVAGSHQLCQRSTIGFNEKGAEASSVTIDGWDTSTGKPVEPEVKVLNLDRPFLFFILERHTNGCIMAGKFAEP